MIIPDADRMTDSAVREVIPWLKALPQERMRELHAINTAWWEQPDLSTSHDNLLVKIVRDWIEENGGDPAWWIRIETKEIES